MFEWPKYEDRSQRYVGLIKSIIKFDEDERLFATHSTRPIYMFHWERHAPNGGGGGGGGNEWSAMSRL